MFQNTLVVVRHDCIKKAKKVLSLTKNRKKWDVSVKIL